MLAMLTVFMPLCDAIQCYSCDTDVDGPLCATNPSQLAADKRCSADDDYYCIAIRATQATTGWLISVNYICYQ